MDVIPPRGGSSVVKHEPTVAGCSAQSADAADDPLQMAIVKEETVVKNDHDNEAYTQTVCSLPSKEGLVDRLIYSCTRCELSTDRLTTMKSHSAGHGRSPPGILTCEMCDFSSDNHSDLDDHNAQCHAAERFWRANRKKSATARAPIIKTKGEPMYSCTSCSFRHVWWSGMLVHAQHHGSYPAMQYKCGICDYADDIMEDLMEHQQTCHPQIDIPFDVTTTSPSTSTTANAFETYVDEEFASIWLMPSQPKIEAFPSIDYPMDTTDFEDCTMDVIVRIRVSDIARCHQGYLNPSKIAGYAPNYRKRKRIDEDKSYHKIGKTQCGICGARTNAGPDYRRHMSHHGRSPPSVHQCRYCDYSAALSIRVTSHEMQIHHHKTNSDGRWRLKQLSPRKFCAVCGARSHTVAARNCHEVCHGRQPPGRYQCSYCDYSVDTSARSVICHEIRRHGRKSQSRQPVTKSERSNRLAKALMTVRKHHKRAINRASTSSVLCDICGDRVQNRNLMLHSSHHNRQPPGLYQCRTCDYSSDIQVIVDKHEHRCHNNNNNSNNNNNNSNNNTIDLDDDDKKSNHGDATVDDVIRNFINTFDEEDNNDNNNQNNTVTSFSIDDENTTITADDDDSNSNTNNNNNNNSINYSINNSNNNSLDVDDDMDDPMGIRITGESDLYGKHGKKTRFVTVASVKRKQAIDRLRKNEPQKGKGPKCAHCPGRLTEGKESNHLWHHGRDPPGQYQCSHCDYSTDRANTFEKHRKVHGGVYPIVNTKTFTCSVCTTKFDSKTGFVKHMSQHGRDPPGKHECSECDYSTDKSNTFEKHLRSHGLFVSVYSKSKTMTYTSCPVCKTKLFSKKGYESHMFHHGRDPPGEHQCRFCDYSADTINSVHQHESRVHKPQKGNGPKCAHCPARLTEGKESDHLWHHGRDPPGQYQCSHCDYSTDRANTQGGLYPIANTKTYTCSVCETKFESKLGFDSHMSHHGRDPPGEHRCRFCDFSADTINSVHQHESRVHSNIPDFTKRNEKKRCPVCKENLCSVQSLRNHMTYHGRDPPGLFQCRFCDLSHDVPANLIRHELKTHGATDSTYELHTTCRICGQQCGKLLEFKCHMNCHGRSPPGRLQCTRCDFSTDTWQPLTDHLISHHNATILGSDGHGTDAADIRNGRDRPIATTTNYARHHVSYSSAFPSQPSRPSICSSSMKQCEICGVQLHEVMLEGHMTHHGRDPPGRFQCQTCDYSSEILQVVRKHMIKAHVGLQGIEPSPASSWGNNSMDGIRVNHLYKSAETGGMDNETENATNVSTRIATNHEQRISFNDQYQRPILPRPVPVDLYDMRHGHVHLDRARYKLSVVSRDKSSIADRLYQCHLCPFKSLSLGGLKWHITRRHPAPTHDSVWPIDTQTKQIVPDNRGQVAMPFLTRGATTANDDSRPVIPTVEPVSSSGMPSSTADQPHTSARIIRNSINITSRRLIRATQFIRWCSICNLVLSTKPECVHHYTNYPAHRNVLYPAWKCRLCRFVSVNNQAITEHCVVEHKIELNDYGQPLIDIRIVTPPPASTDPVVDHNSSVVGSDPIVSDCPTPATDSAETAEASNVVGQSPAVIQLSDDEVEDGPAQALSQSASQVNEHNDSSSGLVIDLSEDEGQVETATTTTTTADVAATNDGPVITESFEHNVMTTSSATATTSSSLATTTPVIAATTTTTPTRKPTWWDDVMADAQAKVLAATSSSFSQRRASSTSTTSTTSTTSITTLSATSKTISTASTTTPATTAFLALKPSAKFVGNRDHSPSGRDPRSPSVYKRRSIDGWQPSAAISRIASPRVVAPVETPPKMVEYSFQHRPQQQRRPQQQQPQQQQRLYPRRQQPAVIPVFRVTGPQERQQLLQYLSRKRQERQHQILQQQQHHQQQQQQLQQQIQLSNDELCLIDMDEDDIQELPIERFEDTPTTSDSADAPIDSSSPYRAIESTSANPSDNSPIASSLHITQSADLDGSSLNDMN